MLATVFKMVLLLSAASSVTIVLLYMMRGMMKNRLPHRLALWLWIPVLLQLVNPFVPEMPAAKLTAITDRVNTFIGSMLPQNMAKGGIDIKTELQGVPGTQNGISKHQLNTAPEKSPDTTVAGQVKTSSLWNKGAEALPWIWLMGALLLAVRLIVGYLLFKRSIVRNSLEISDTQTLLLLQSFCSKLGIHHHIRLYFFEKTRTPMLIGVFRPMVLLPMEQYSREELSFVLAHELSHCKNHDLTFKWAGEIVRCIHWFNPLVYLAVNSVGRDCELCCDEQVVRVTGDQTAYGNTLIKMAGKRNRMALPANTMWESRKHMRKRIINLAHMNQLPHFRRVRATVYVSLLLGLIVCGTAACKGIAEPSAASSPAPGSSSTLSSSSALSSSSTTTSSSSSSTTSSKTGTVSQQPAASTVDSSSSNEKDNSAVKEIQSEEERQAYYDRYFGPIDVPTAILNQSWNNPEQVDAQEIFMFFIANSSANNGLALMDEKQERGYFNKTAQTYQFPASIYEPIVRKYFHTSPEHLKTAEAYNKSTDTYDIKSLEGFGGGA